VGHTDRVGIEEKAELVRRSFEHLANREPATAVECFAPDVKFDFTRSRGPNSAMFVGRREVQRNWEEVLGMWTEFVLEPHDFIEVGEDGLLFSIRGRMTGRDGIELTVRAAHLWTIREGFVAHATFFQTREDALQAAGLSVGET
jgi:ketosteroid isomerase-like protein